MPDQLTVKTAVADIEPGTDEGDSPHGSFSVILSAPVKDRDGETLKPDEWVQPLPEHITFDIDHGMSVASTVGSGKPTLDDAGNLRVDGTYASTDLAQETRKLVNEKHIRTTSVAFLRRSSDDAKGKGKPKVQRELLNGAFVSVPANTAALVLSSKDFRAAVLTAAGAKEGRRNNKTDAANIQSIHDAATTLGADCSGGKAVTRKAVAELPDELREQLSEVDPDELPEPVQELLRLVTAPGDEDPDDESSAVDENADESAAADEAAADESAEPSAADLASTLAVRAHGIRVLAGMTHGEE